MRTIISIKIIVIINTLVCSGNSFTYAALCYSSSFLIVSIAANELDVRVRVTYSKKIASDSSSLSVVILLDLSAAFDTVNHNLYTID